MAVKDLRILVGNIGTGKSTLGKKFIADGFVGISRDHIRYSLGLGKYIFNPTYESVVWSAELFLVENFMQRSVKLLIDEVSIDRASRYRYIKLAKKYNYTVTALILPQESKAVCVDRRMRHEARGYTREQWEGVWERFNKQYEVPICSEGIDNILHVKDMP